MTTKTIELTIEERRDLCHVLGHVMEMFSNTYMQYSSAEHRYVWNTPADEQEYNELRDLRDKLKPVLIQKSGWVHKDHISEAHPPSIADYEYVTWEEFE
jgi:hypothetical protein